MDAKTLGRCVGLGMLTSFAVGMFSNFRLQPDLFADGGLLANAAGHPGAIGWISLLGLMTALVSITVACVLTAHLRHRAPVLTILYLAIVTAGLATSIVEFSSLYAFGGLSEAYASAASDQASHFLASNAALTGLRDGVHFLDKLLGGVGVLVLFSLFYRERLVPRLLASYGILAVLAQMLTVGRALFGYEVLMALLAPISLAFVLTIVWLLVKGFAVTAPTSEYSPRPS